MERGRARTNVLPLFFGSSMFWKAVERLKTMPSFMALPFFGLSKNELSRNSRPVCRSRKKTVSFYNVWERTEGSKVKGNILSIQDS
jgi:hypothetical protein